MHRTLYKTAATLLVMIASVLPLNAQVTVRADPANNGGQIDRSLFSLVNYQAVLERGSSIAERAVQWLNMDATYQRLATTPPQFEPANDNSEPSVTNWAGFFPQQLFASQNRRYVGRELVEKVRDDGMEPVLLLAYNLPWLSPTGDITYAPDDPDEWAEFASAALRAVNGEPGSGDYELRVKHVEIWNEPDTELYWKGRADEYYELFRTVAERLALDHPDVLMGGPSALNYTSPWALNFVRSVGEHLDFYVYHSYNEDPERIVERVKQMSQFLRQTTGRDIPIMITESDNFGLTGDAKMEYLIRRQILLQDVRDQIDGFHHFQAPAYREGDRFFGVVRDNGSVIDHNYYPFWLFRDLVGEEINLQVSGGSASQRSQMLSIAAAAADRMSTVMYLPRSATEAIEVTVESVVPPALSNGLVIISRVSAERSGVTGAMLNDGASLRRETIRLEPGTGVSITILEGNPEELIWTDIEIDRTSGLVGQPINARVRMINTSVAEIRGSMQMLGFPEEWDVTEVEGSSSFRDLEPGAVHEVTYQLIPSSPTPVGGSGAYIFVSARPPRSRSIRMNSLAVNLQVDAPVRTVARPNRIYVTAGYEGEVTARLTNTLGETVVGEFGLELPQGFSSSRDRSVTLRADDQVELTFPIEASGSIVQGTYTGHFRFQYNGIAFREPFEIIATEFRIDLESRVVDLSDYYNVDGVTFQDNFQAFDLDGFGGRFALPGELLPPPGEKNYLGVRFAFPEVASDAHLVETRGQSIDLPAGRFDRLALLTTTVNSDKSEVLTVVYADGSTQRIELTVTDWCVQPKNNEIPVVRAPYRHMTEGVLRDCNPQIFLLQYPIDASKEVRELRLPDRPTLYIVAASLVRE